MAKMPRIALLLAATVLVLVGCKSPAQRARVLTKDQEQSISENVLKQAANLRHHRTINYADPVLLPGYVPSGAPKAGTTIELI